MKIYYYLLAAAIGAAACACTEKSNLASPNGNIKVDFRLTKDGVPVYCATYCGDTVVAPSSLGFDTEDRKSVV